MGLFGIGKKKDESPEDAKKKKDPTQVGDETINCSMKNLQERMAMLAGADPEEAEEEKKED